MFHCKKNQSLRTCAVKRNIRYNDLNQSTLIVCSALLHQTVVN